MTVEYIKSITDRYERLGYPAYKWYRAGEQPPWTALKKPISESRLGVLTTAGAYWILLAGILAAGAIH